MDIYEPVVLLSVEQLGSSIEVIVRRIDMKAPVEPDFDTSIAVRAFPFTGTLETQFMLAQLHDWAEDLAGLDQGIGRVALGGNRAALLTIEAFAQKGGPTAGRVVLDITLTPSEDDPYPTLNYLIHDVSPTWADTIARAKTLG